MKVMDNRKNHKKTNQDLKKMMGNGKNHKKKKTTKKISPQNKGAKNVKTTPPPPQTQSTTTTPLLTLENCWFVDSQTFEKVPFPL